MNIYFARSIRGDHADGEKRIFQAILDAIKACGHIPALETPPINQHFDDRNEYIYQRDITWIYNSDVMIAEVSNPSLGVGFEIAYAMHVCHIPILAVAFKDTNVSAMIQGSLDVFFYRGTDDLVAQVQAFLSEGKQP